MNAIYWGEPISINYILSMVFVFAVLIGLIFLLKNKSEKVVKIVLFPFSLLGLGAIIYNILAYGNVDQWNPLTFNDNVYYHLPLNFCSYTALLCPLLVLMNKRNILGNYLLPGSIGAMAALTLRESGCYTMNIFEGDFIWYFYPHMFEFIIPQVFIFIKKVEIKPLYIPFALAITIVLYTISYNVGHYVNIKHGVDTNYFFGERPNNPVLEMCWNIFPVKYWYMFLCFPLFLIVNILYSIPYFIKKGKEHRTKKEALALEQN